jgi:hypothetical protein
MNAPSGLRANTPTLSLPFALRIGSPTRRPDSKSNIIVALLEPKTKAFPSPLNEKLETPSPRSSGEHSS